MKTNKLITLVVIILAFCVFDQSKNKAVQHMMTSTWVAAFDFENHNFEPKAIDNTDTNSTDVQQTKSIIIISLVIEKIGHEIISKIINSKF